MAEEAVITFKPLNTAQGVRAGGSFIGKCQGFLPNKMQCTQAASWAAIAVDGSEITQYCNKHKVHIEAGIHSAPVMPIKDTGTVQYIPIANSDLQVKVTTEVVESGDSTDNTSS